MDSSTMYVVIEHDDWDRNAEFSWAVGPFDSEEAAEDSISCPYAGRRSPKRVPRRTPVTSFGTRTAPNWRMKTASRDLRVPKSRSSFRMTKSSRSGTPTIQRATRTRRIVTSVPSGHRSDCDEVQQAKWRRHRECRSHRAGWSNRSRPYSWQARRLPVAAIVMLMAMRSWIEALEAIRRIAVGVELPVYWIPHRNRSLSFTAVSPR